MNTINEMTLEEIRKVIKTEKNPICRYNLLARASNLLSMSGNQAAQQISDRGTVLCQQTAFIRDLGQLGIAGIAGGGINAAQAKIISGFSEQTQERLIRHIVGNKLNRREAAHFLEQEEADPANTRRIAQKSRQPWQTVTPDTGLIEELQLLYKNGPAPTPKKDETQASGTGAPTRRDVIQKLRESTKDVTENGVMDPDVFREVFGTKIGENSDDGDIDKAIRFAYGLPEKKQDMETVTHDHLNGNGKNGSETGQLNTKTTLSETVVCDPETTTTGKALCCVLSSIATLASLLIKVRPSDLRDVLNHPQFEPQVKAHIRTTYKSMSEFEEIARVFGWEVGT